MKLLITGGLGFIGSNFILYLLKNYNDYEIINLDQDWVKIGENKKFTKMPLNLGISEISPGKFM